jgi:redox-sensing transcriptional repressor
MRAKIPEPTLRRLPLYCEYLRVLSKRGITRIASAKIAQDLELDQTQVRKDLAVTGVRGKPKIGHDTGELIDAIEKFLGWQHNTGAVLAGCGHLGTALLGFAGFRDYGLTIVAAFDSDPRKLGTRVHGHRVQPLENLPDVAEREQVHIGIITAPAAAAQTIADQMVMAGIRAIWNFSPALLTLHHDIVVRNENLACGLAMLSHRLAETAKENV